MLLFCLFCTLGWGLLAHAYAFLNPTFSHDSLTIYASQAEELWKVQLGRYLAPVYRALTRGSLAAPWLIGILSLSWISLAVFGVAEMFALSSKKAIALLSGVMTTNLTVTAMAGTYIYELDIDMLALVCAVFAAKQWFQWTKAETTVRWKHFAQGAALMAGAMGLYQSYISVALILIMSVCLLKLAEGVKPLDVLKDGLLAVGMVLVGSGLYFAGVKISTVICGIELATGYNSLTNIGRAFSYSLSPIGIISEYIFQVIYTYIYGLRKIVQPVGEYPAAVLLAGNVILFVLTGIAVVRLLCQRRMCMMSKLMFLALGALLPFAANIAGFLNGGAHDLMLYGIWMLYPLALLLIRTAQSDARGAKRGNWQKNVAVCMVILFLIGNIQTSNALYLKKDLERQSTLSMMTRLAERMDSTEGYVPGETPVVLIRSEESIASNVMPGFERYAGITGGGGNKSVTYDATWLFYFSMIINEPLYLYSGSDYTATVCGAPYLVGSVEEYRTFTDNNQSALNAMPAFPAADSVQMIDGVLAVKI